jgi:hypothetical protein
VEKGERYLLRGTKIYDEEQLKEKILKSRNYK